MGKMAIVIESAFTSGRASSLKRVFLDIIRRSFAEDSKLLLCFICSLGTAIGLALSATCFIWENSSLLSLFCVGLIVSAICFSVFLYVAWKMD
jgi:hypothetical protein